MLLSKACEGDFVIEDGCHVGICGAADGVGWHQLTSQSLIDAVLCHGHRHKQVHPLPLCYPAHCLQQPQFLWGLKMPSYL